jgi:ATP-dependent DNA helicase PIF1
MTKRQNVEALDNSLRDIMGRSNLPFGGKTIVLGGDFRQVLPIVRKGFRAQMSVLLYEGRIFGNPCAI